MLAIAAAVTPAAAEPVLEPLGLYAARTVVSGTAEPNRHAGFRSCFLDVLVKVSGDPSIVHDGRVAALARAVDRRIVGFTYKDRLEGRPVHDDQGTYDRPHHLTVRFHRDAIDRDIESLGRQPWPEPRPNIVVALAVSGRKQAFRLTTGEDADASADMRSALAAAGEAVGLRVSVPASTSAVEWAATSSPRSGGVPVRLAGDLVWSDASFGWIVRWALPWQGKTVRWSVSGVSFDEAFRVGLRGAAQVLSGHDEPR